MQANQPRAFSAGVAATSTRWPDLPSYFGMPPQVIWMVVLTIILVAIFVFPDTRLYTTPAAFIPWHTALELISIAVSLMVAALAWNLRSHSGNNRLIVLGAALFAVSLIDGGHTLSYLGMPDFITPNSVNKGIYFWLAARYLAALSLLVIALLPDRYWSQPRCLIVYSAGLAISVGVFVVVLLHLDSLPLMHVPGAGLTVLKVSAEVIVAGLYAIAAIALMVQNYREHSANRLWLAAAAWTLALADLLFTRYFDVTDLSNTLGHVYKVIAYAMMYRALFVAGVQTPYNELSLERSWLRSLLAAIPDPIWLKSADGKYLSCNDAFERLFAVRQDDILGKSDHDIFSL